MVLCTHHNPGTQGSGSELGGRAWAGCLGWNKGDSVCAGISLRDTPGPFPRHHWCWLPKTAHPPPARTDRLLSKPTFSAPPLGLHTCCSLGLASPLLFVHQTPTHASGPSSDVISSSLWSVCCHRTSLDQALWRPQSLTPLGTPPLSYTHTHPTG